MEYWKDIKDFEGFYQISNECRVRSLDRYVKHSRGGLKKVNGRILKPASDGRYLFVNLIKDGVDSLKTIHRLMAETFIPNPDGLPCVNHKNEITTDNRIENLEWCDYKYNCNFGTRNKRIAKKNTNNKHRSKPILQYDLDGNFIKEWPSLGEIKRELNISKSCISYACDGKSKTSHNYIWKWKY